MTTARAVGAPAWCVLAVAGALLATPIPAASAAPESPHQAPASPERLVEIRVQGNYATPDQDVIQMAGVAVGQPVAPDIVAEVEARLRASGRFDEVEVRKRYRSFTSLDEVALIVIVRERPAATPDAPAPGPLKRTLGRMMWLPVLNYTDGYGFTYGARVSFVDVLGKESRVSLPLTWGGTREIAGDLDKTLHRRALDRVFGGVSLSQRENPHYEVDDRRLTLSGGAGKALAEHVRVGVHAGWTDVDFGGLDSRFGSYGGEIVVDTRANPAFPRNAVFVRGGWDAAAIEGASTVNRYTAEARGYVGLLGSSVLAARALYQVADGPTPPYLQVLVGGAESLRGFAAGAFAGDNRFVSSLELRVPLTSPLRVGQAGLDVFVDASTAYDHGVSLRQAEMHYGTGAGAFLLLPILQLNMDVARGSDGDWRVHFMGGFRF